MCSASIQKNGDSNSANHTKLLNITEALTANFKTTLILASRNASENMKMVTSTFRTKIASFHFVR